jgi:hypothetical protein
MGKCITSDQQQAPSCWEDDAGMIHICESSAPLQHELLVWTLCDRDVEAGAAFFPYRRDKISCSKCAAADRVLKMRARAARHEPALLALSDRSRGVRP